MLFVLVKEAVAARRTADRQITELVGTIRAVADTAVRLST